MTLFLGWASLGFFTGIAWNQFYGDGRTAVANITIGIVSAICLGLAVHVVGGSFLPEWALLRTFLPAVLGAAGGLIAYRTLSGN